MTRMRRTRVMGTALIALAAAMLAADASAQESEVSQGASVYGRVCGRCHNPRSPLERSDNEWVIIANHMRVRGNLTRDQIRSVVAFLQATNQDPRERTTLVTIGQPAAALPQVSAAAPSTDAATIARGKELITQKACIGCHILAGSGGQVGPRLDGVVQRRDPEFVRRKLTNPLFNNATSMMPNFGLSDDEIEAVLAYLASLRS